ATRRTVMLRWMFFINCGLQALQVAVNDKHKSGHRHMKCRSSQGAVLRKKERFPRCEEYDLDATRAKAQPVMQLHAAHIAASPNYLGAKEATIASNRGSPRSGSRSG